MLRRRLVEEIKRSQTLMDTQHASDLALRQSRLKIRELEGMLRALKERTRSSNVLT